jgi:hypothetical protein
MLTLTNSFHNTSITLRAGRPRKLFERTLSRRQVAHARKVLCGMPDCQCGEDVCKTRGMRRLTIVPQADGSATVEFHVPR